MIVQTLFNIFSHPRIVFMLRIFDDIQIVHKNFGNCLGTPPSLRVKSRMLHPYTTGPGPRIHSKIEKDLSQGLFLCHPGLPVMYYEHPVVCLYCISDPMGLSSVTVDNHFSTPRAA